MARLQAPPLRKGALFQFVTATPSGSSTTTIGCLDRGVVVPLDRKQKAFFEFVAAAEVELQTEKARLAYIKLYYEVIRGAEVLASVDAMLGELYRGPEQRALLARLKKRYGQVISLPSITGVSPWEGTVFVLDGVQLVKVQFKLLRNGHMEMTRTVLERDLPVERGV